MAKKSTGNSNPLVIVLLCIVLVQFGIIISLLVKQKKEAIPIEPLELVEESYPEIEIEKEVLAKVALVIDDWGYNRRNIPYLEKLDVPLTLSILPSLIYSKEIASFAKGHMREAILHLPLEPRSLPEGAELEPDTILTTMGKDEIFKILNKDLKSLPMVVGVSNHMGSKATASEPLMRIIFEELARRNLFFLDSLVISRPVSRKIAKDLGVGYITRDIFLDNEQDYEYISNQFEKLIRLAKKKGKAVGIGHDRKLTLRVLDDKISQLDSGKQQIEFVLLSELVE
ncbi:MAG: divergent polysaccharide deacetylase family protein [Candidatus Omnitrophica bacterium]|nr:divergent polysaccharide deacetylase family protein [Candidatus Omnitrophota bacterium]